MTLRAVAPLLVDTTQDGSDDNVRRENDKLNI